MSAAEPVRTRAAPTEGDRSPRGPSDVPVTDPAETDVLPLVRTLCRALADEEVRYCHWKSNEALARSASGDNDLDLLVGRSDARAFEAIIGRLGFKIARAPRTKEMPGVFHAYALDEASGKLVHVHAHYQLVLGNDMTKNYRVPIEEPYLASAEQGPVFRVPAPELEYVVFVVRMVLKHSTLDAILTRQGALSPSEGRELRYLRARIDAGRVAGIVREHLPFFDAGLWDRCLGCLDVATPSRTRIAAAYALERALADNARRTPILDAPVRLWRRARVTARRRVLHRPAPRGRLENGGALIALVGGDGAGKSTAVAEVSGWLSTEFAATEVHFGKPPRSWTSALVQRMWKRGVRRGARASSGATVAELAGSADGSMSGRIYVKLVQHVLLARDRYLMYRRARRAVADGRIVVADRFPIPDITLMDAPVASRLVGARRAGPVAAVLARLERRYYGRIGRPDVLLVLRVDPEIAVERKRGTDDEHVVRGRSEEISAVDWSRSGAVVVDAGRPRDDVLREVKSAIWSAL